MTAPRGGNRQRVKQAVFRSFAWHMSTARALLDRLGRSTLIRLGNRRDLAGSRENDERRKALARSYRGDVQALLEDLTLNELVDLCSEPLLVGGREYRLPAPSKRYGFDELCTLMVRALTDDFESNAVGDDTSKPARSAPDEHNLTASDTRKAARAGVVVESARKPQMNRSGSARGHTPRSSTELPEVGLLIRERYVKRILDGKKTWEIRSRRTERRGRIGLIQSKSGLVVGEANLVRVEGPLTEDDVIRNQEKMDVDAFVPDEPTYAWVLEGVKRYDPPVPYQHRSGAVIWARLK